MGLLLGIPILAVLKCILDNIPSTRRVGMFLGDESPAGRRGTGKST